MKPITELRRLNVRMAEMREGMAEGRQRQAELIAQIEMEPRQQKILLHSFVAANVALVFCDGLVEQEPTTAQRRKAVTLLHRVDAAQRQLEPLKDQRLAIPAYQAAAEALDDAGRSLIEVLTKEPE